MIKDKAHWKKFGTCEINTLEIMAIAWLYRPVSTAYGKPLSNSEPHGVRIHLSSGQSLHIFDSDYEKFKAWWEESFNERN